MRRVAKKYRIQLSMKFYPEYELFIDQIMQYDDEKFAMELPEFIVKDGSIVVN